MARELSFATFNLYNLQLPGVPMYQGNTYTQEEYDRKLSWTAIMLQVLDADVIGFQELWSPQCLVDAFSAAALSDQYELFHQDNGGTGISVAAAVRRPLIGSNQQWIKKFPDDLILKKRQPGSTLEPDYTVSVTIDAFSRPVLKMLVTPQHGPDFELFVAHLKSKMPMLLDRDEAAIEAVRKNSSAIGTALSTIRRTAEAAALRVLLNHSMRDTDTPVVVMGDINDSQLSVTTCIITEQPPYRLYLASQAGRTSDRGLYTVATLQEYRSMRDVYYTHIHEGGRESLDHILVSEQFYDHSNKRQWSFKEMRVINDHLDDTLKHTSDHGVVKATFIYKPAG
ncbi:endonuclease/exonuclease/phosphatase family protein [bacterium]|nr:endonuclease/exonuclease/phosphatase family protein [candidate division CSSED10-310 bacterium]